jgi:hypothetical protein
MTRKQFITIIDTLVSRLEKGEEMYTCNEIDDICLGGLGIESDMRAAYENLMGEKKGYIPVGFVSNVGYGEPCSYRQAQADKAARRVSALSLFKESVLRSEDYKGFKYEKK